MEWVDSVVFDAQRGRDQRSQERQKEADTLKSVFEGQTATLNSVFEGQTDTLKSVFEGHEKERQRDSKLDFEAFRNARSPVKSPAPKFPALQSPAPTRELSDERTSDESTVVISKRDSTPKRKAQDFKSPIPKKKKNEIEFPVFKPGDLPPRPLLDIEKLGLRELSYQGFYNIRYYREEEDPNLLKLMEGVHCRNKGPGDQVAHEERLIDAEEREIVFQHLCFDIDLHADNNGFSQETKLAAKKHLHYMLQTTSSEIRKKHFDQNRAQVYRLETEVSGLKTQLSDCEEQVSGLESQLSDRNEEVSFLKTQLSDRDVQVSDLESKLKQLQNDYAKTKNDLDKQTKISGSFWNIELQQSESKPFKQYFRFGVLRQLKSMLSIKLQHQGRVNVAHIDDENMQT